MKRTGLELQLLSSACFAGQFFPHHNPDGLPGLALKNEFDVMHQRLLRLRDQLYKAAELGAATNQPWSQELQLKRGELTFELRLTAVELHVLREAVHHVVVEHADDWDEFMVVFGGSTFVYGTVCSDYDALLAKLRAEAPVAESSLPALW